MQGNVNIPDSTITTNLSFRQLVLMNMQQLTNFPYIEKDFDALTDYELLSLVVKFLNDVIANQNEQNDSITRMYESFLALQDYVNNTKDTLEDAFNELDDYVRNYFDNLDVQEEINNKLDEMLEDGVLEQIIEQFLQSTAIWCFNTVADMKAATNLIDGSDARTLGYYSINDGGGALYHITDTESLTEYQEELPNNLYATLIKEDYANAKQYGLKSDGTDSSDKVTSLFKNKKILFPDGLYVFSNVTINHDIEIIGSHATIKPTRKSESNNRYNTLLSIENNANIKIKNITFEGYTNIESQSGTLEDENSLVFVNGCNKLEVKDCIFKNFDGSYATSTPSQFTQRRATLFTIHDTLNSYFVNNTFTNIKGNENIYCIDNVLNRNQINIDFINNKIIDIYTTALDFIGNIANLKNNYYNFEYSGSCLNVFALYLFVENEEIYGSFDNVYDNCEELYFRGIDANIQNIINNANVTNTIVHLSAENCVINNLINNNDQTMNCVRNYFGTNNSNIHKDCTTSIASFTSTKITNSKLIAKHCVTSYNTSATDYNLLIQNCELKSSLASNAWLIATAPFELTLVDNIIHLCITAGSGAPTVIYNRSDNILKLIKATNNKIVNDTETQQRFLVGTLPDFISFIGNTTNRGNSIIAPDLTNVKAYGNYNYTES